MADAITPEITGIGRYSLELANRLPKQPGVESVTLLRGTEVIPNVERLLRAQSQRSKLARFAIKHARRYRRPPRLDLVHGPNYSAPDLGCAAVVTIHDLSVFRFPEFHPPARVVEFERNFRASVERADHLITDCETIRTEVVAFTGRKPEHVTAIPLGIASSFSPISSGQRSEVLRRHGLPERGYGLTLSSLEPRKRIESLITAWGLLPPSLRKNFPLVVAGASGWKNEGLHEAIARGASEGWVLPLGFVPEADLPAIYSGASLFVYPSLYEGFGLPVVEAMACGTPTVIAAGCCLEEVSKGAAMTSHPDDSSGFALSIARALEDTAWRSKAASAGIHVAKGYTWQRCVEETVGVYQGVIQGGAGEKRNDPYERT